MVHIILSSTKGNQGLRYFPHSGYLGLTPVKVEGIVRTKLDDDMKQLLARSITISVRCYESRVGRISTLHSNVLVDHTQVLWEKPDGVDHAPIGEMEFPFRITVPAKVAGFSTAVFVDYKCMWRVEAILNHAPLSGVGTRQIRHFELPLVRYDLPTHQPTPSVISLRLHQETNKPRAPRIRYCINSPTSPIGPLDIVSIPIYLLPLDAAVSIRSASVIVERRIELKETPPPMSPTASQSFASSSRPAPHSSSTTSLLSLTPSSPLHDTLHDGLTPTSSLSSSSTSPNTLYPSTTSITPLITTSSAPPDVTSKVIINPVAGAESSGQFARDEKGIWTKTLTLQWPAAKSNSRWATGETIQSELVSVKYFARVKIVVSSPSGTESIDLADNELLIVSTNEAERQLAISKYNDLLDSLAAEKARSASKSPRRLRKDRDTVPPPPSPASPSHVYKPSVVSAQYPSASSTKGKSSSRRPHTSAGPRDKAFDFAGARMDSAYGRARDPREQQKEREAAEGRGPGGRSVGSVGEGLTSPFRKRRTDASERPETSTGRPASKASLFFSSPRMVMAASGSSGTSTAASTSTGEESDEMKEWEEELARIEMQSRRSSDMLGFAGKRKRSTGAPQVVLPVTNGYA